MKKTTLKITACGMFIALSIVMTRFLGSYQPPIMGLPVIRTNLGYVPIILTSFLLGPFYGGAVGAISDIVGYFINPMGGGYYLPFTICSCLIGVLPTLVLKLIKTKKNTAMIITTVSCTVFVSVVSTFFLKLYYNMAFMVMILPRTLTALAMSVLYCILVIPIYNLIKKNKLI